MQPENIIWRIEPVRVFFALDSRSRWIRYVAGYRNSLLKLPFGDAVGTAFLPQLRISSHWKHGWLH